MALIEELRQLEDEVVKKEREVRDRRIRDDELNYLRDDISIIKQQIEHIAKYIENRLK
ncbi:unnamed protein product [marine sediment metagenome]|uniref:Uncharacterized protein n=1 Tax=marine sediment metagenome TaxID=412755 RepID=X1M6R1_9ZZZZ